MNRDNSQLSRRRFLSNFAFATTAISTGVGSWVIPADWANAAAGPIKVGIATDLTGPMGYAGNADANVAKMVIKEINDAGGLLGRPLELYIEDTASNEAVAVGNVRKLIQRDKVDLTLGGITSSMRNAIKDVIVSRGKTLYIYPQLYEGKECTPYLFCTGPTPAQQCDEFIPWLVKNGGKRFALPSSNYVWPHTLNVYARKVIEANGGEVVLEEYYPLDQIDFSSTVNRIISNKVDVVFNTVIPPGVGPMFKQLYEAGFLKNGGRLACVYYDENTLGINQPNEIEGLASLSRLFQSADAGGPGQRQDPGCLREAVSRHFPVRGRQCGDRDLPRVEAVGSRGQGSRQRGARRGGQGARSRQNRGRPGRASRDGTGSAPLQDEDVHSGRQGRQIRSRCPQRRSGRSQGMLSGC